MIELNKPLKLTIWFVSCVAIGLLLATEDGVSADAALRAALVMAGLGLSAAVIAWLWSSVSKPDVPGNQDQD